MMEIYLSIISLSAAVIVYIMLSGPTVWDRLLAFNLLSGKITLSIVCLALIFDKSYLLDVAIVYALMGFIGVVLLSYFVEKRGKMP